MRLVLQALPLTHTIQAPDRRRGRKSKFCLASKTAHPKRAQAHTRKRKLPRAKKPLIAAGRIDNGQLRSYYANGK
jgi:hypothetical protein